VNSTASNDLSCVAAFFGKIEQQNLSESLYCNIRLLAIIPNNSTSHSYITKRDDNDKSLLVVIAAAAALAALALGGGAFY
jgi:hypothetical protein